MAPVLPKAPTELWQADIDRIIHQRHSTRLHEKEDPSTMANIRIEKIENGYIIVYSKQGIPEKRRYAGDMRAVGDAVIAAVTELELTGK